MTGIAGYAHRHHRPKDRILDEISNSLCQTRSVKVDRWKNDRIGVCRVHHGVTNRRQEPVFNKNRSKFLLMDGEVFGYRGKKSNVGMKDYEVDDAGYCLSLFEKLKDEAFKQLNGSFSLAIYDFGKQEFWLVTDRFCSRPIFYSVTADGSIYFGSKLASVLASPKVSRELNESSVFELLSLQMILGSKTIYKHIHVIPPATVLHFTDGQLSLRKYWQLRYRPIERSEKFYITTLAQTLKRAVKLRTETNSRYGLLLSGGSDSRTVLAATTKDTQAFTVRETENREVRLARQVARTKGCKHIIIQRPADHYIRIIDKAVELSDCLNASVHAHFINLFDQIRKESDIILHGFYLDNFRGYTYPFRCLKILGMKIHTKFHVDSYLYGLPDDKFLQAFLDDGRFVNQLLMHSPERVFTPVYAARFSEQIRQSIKEVVKDARERGATPSDVWDHILCWHSPSEVRSYLHLSHIRAFMPERTIMFDNALFDLYLKLPIRFKKNRKMYWSAMKKLNKQMALIPNARTRFSPQPPFLIESILRWLVIVKGILIPNRQKSSESSFPNHAELLRHTAEYQAIVEATIRDPACLDPSIFNIPGILGIFKDHVNRTTDHFTLLSLILTFGIWLKKFQPVKK